MEMEKMELTLFLCFFKEEKFDELILSVAYWFFGRAFMFQNEFEYILVRRLSWYVINRCERHEARQNLNESKINQYIGADFGMVSLEFKLNELEWAFFNRIL